MSPIRNQPVEISNHLNPGEWTQDSLNELLDKYLRDFADMGAQRSEVTTEVSPTDTGGLDVKVVWTRTGEWAFDDFGAPESSNHDSEADRAESAPDGKKAEGSQGLGAVFGEADRSPHDL